MSIRASTGHPWVAPLALEARRPPQPTAGASFPGFTKLGTKLQTHKSVLICFQGNESGSDGESGIAQQGSSAAHLHSRGQPGAPGSEPLSHPLLTGHCPCAQGLLTARGLGFPFRGRVGRRRRAVSSAGCRAGGSRVPTEGQDSCPCCQRWACRVARPRARWQRCPRCPGLAVLLSSHIRAPFPSAGGHRTSRERAREQRQGAGCRCPPCTTSSLF